MPVAQLFEAEVDILDLSENSRTIISNGYTCMMHMHTYNDEIMIKALMKSIKHDING